MIEMIEELEKEFYNKECVAENINFVVGETNKEDKTLNNHKRFFCNLTTILARDREVVVVRLKVLASGCEVYLFKNFA